MKRIFATVLAAACVTATAPAVWADDADDGLIPESAIPGEFSANVALTTEYFFRGISQSDDSPAIQGGFDWSLDSVAGAPVGLYAGVWASNIDFNTGNSIELDVYAGLQGTLPIGDGLSWTAGGIYYFYPGAPGGSHQDYAEAAFSLGYDFGPAAVTLMYNWSPDFFASTGSANYVGGKIDIPIWKLTLSPYAGYQWIQDNAAFGVPDYWHYGASISATVVGFDMSVTYTDTDVSKTTCPDLCDATVYFTVSKSF